MQGCILLVISTESYYDARIHEYKKKKDNFSKNLGVFSLLCVKFDILLLTFWSLLIDVCTGYMRGTRWRS